MMTLYVKAKSKKELNERLAAGDQVMGTSYTPFGVSTYTLDTLTEPAIIKVYDKKVMGNPVAKAYGVYEPSKNRVK